MKALEQHTDILPISKQCDEEERRLADFTKLKMAYLNERTKLEMLEVELNRDKVVMIDEHGNMKKISFVSEH